MFIENFTVSQEDTVEHILNVVNKGGRGIAFICDKNKLIAVVTDGDIRRYIMRGGNLKSRVHGIANYYPKCIFIETLFKTNIFEYMKENRISAVPIVNKNKEIIQVMMLNGDIIYRKPLIKNDVIVMAGGKGTRLLPYTKILPKPLMPVGEKTILELIFEQFLPFGFRKFFLILNYKKELIKAYFNELDVKYPIEFINETEYLGTGGGIKLLEGKIKETFFLTNCDILISEDYAEILKYHKKQSNIITLVCANNKFTIPYGTVELTKNGYVNALKEKPTFSFLSNSGLYVIEPRFFNYIKKEQFVHITDVIQTCIQAGEKVGVYSINEDAWMDMGQLESLETMRIAWSERE